ncbi:MAG: YggS family pyridoxal phosphate-dependent enzyme [Calditrichaeota bacterium]|nr:MAG: YggS family pyridoxal phosphate-dependent enzyme [Calditrichota bacterium]
MKQAILNLTNDIRSTCKQFARDPNEIHLVAVSKTVSAQIAEKAIDAGIRILGESRINDAAEKIQAISRPVSWHLIGHLQSNKVRKAIAMFDLIQSVDSVKLAEKIQSECERSGRKIDVLLQVNTSGETSKYGFSPDEVLPAVHSIQKLPAVQIRGLMTIGALTEDENKIGACFRLLKSQFEEIKKIQLPRVKMDYLSMGMSADYRIAIAEGSNMIRVGRAIFNEND